MDYFYDGSVRRYLVEFIRVFSDIKIQTGPNEDGVITQSRVPIIYGDPSWMVAQLLKDGSENTMMPSPMMSAWIYSIEMANERRQDPTHENTITGAERTFNGTDGSGYGTEVGNRFVIDRYMPVPYDLTFQLDIWTTTTTTKLQILEQIFTYFNPGIQIQTTANRFDWASVFDIEMSTITWSNRSIPNGTEAERDVASIQFKLGAWISPPAKLKRYKVVEQIVTNVKATSRLSDTEINEYFDNPLGCLSDPDTQLIVTPGNFRIKIGVDGYAANEVVLLNQYGVEDPTLSWRDLFSVYGNLEEYETTMRLKLAEDIEEDELDILGTLVFDETRSNVIFYEIDQDTLPSNTLQPVDRIINPVEVYPGAGLPVATFGQRYMLVSNTSDGEEPAMPVDNPWGMQAYPNDIIEYNGTEWIVSFDSGSKEDIEYIVNLTSLNHYTWNGEEWAHTYLGEYFPGYWRLHGQNSDGDYTDNPGGLPIIDEPPCRPSTRG